MTWRQVHAIGSGVLLAAIVVLSPGAVSRALANVHGTPWWWDVVIAIGVGASVLGLLGSLWRRSNPRTWAAVFAAATLLGICTYPLVAQTVSSASEPPWIAMFAPTAAGALGIAFGWRLAAGLGVAGAIASWTAQQSAAWAVPDEQRLSDLVFIVASALCAAAVMEMVRSRAVVVNASQAQAILATARAGEQAAEAHAAATWHAFIHDHVLAALESARQPGSPAPDVRRLAADAKAAFATTERLDDVSVNEIAATLSALESEAVTVQLTHTGGTLPGRVGEAVGAASAEALRNVARHAGVGALVQVRADLAPGLVWLRIHDNGPGFDPQRVSPDRMGIAVSIVGRMQAVGGNAEIRSRRGRGTTITLLWPAGQT